MPALISFLNMHKFSNGKINGLIASYYADDALFKGKEDKEIIEETIVRLKKAYPDMPAPRFTHVTHWEREAYTQGCWSRLGTKTSHLDQINLEFPVGSSGMHPKFNFVLAGEHIAPIGCKGTVHGAYMSGQTAAARLFEHFKPKPKVPSP